MTAIEGPVHPMKNRTLFRLLPVLILACCARAQPAPLQPAAAPSDDIVVLSPFEVSSERGTGYRATNSISATRLDTPLQLVPVNVQVVTKDFLQDTAALNINDALQYQASVSQAENEREQGIFNIRGFTTNRVKRNGFTTYYVHDVGNTERVEVVKGPASLLYGEMEPGGVVNYITRRPGPVSTQSLQVTYGSNNHQRAVLEAGGPLADSNFRYGVTASWLDDDRWTDDWGVRQTAANGVVQWFPWRGATLTLEAQYLRRREDLRSPVFVYNKANYDAWLQLPEATRNAIVSGGAADQPSEFVAVNATGTGLVHSGRRPYWTDVADMFPREWNTSAGDLDSDMEELALSFESPLGDRHVMRAIARTTATDLLWARSGSGSSRLGVGLDGLRGGATGARDQNNKDFFTQIDFVGQYAFDAVKLRWVAGWERSDGEFSGTTWDRGTGATAIPWIYFNPALARTIRNNELGFVAGQNTLSPTFPERPLGDPFIRTVSDDAQDNLVNSFYGVLQANVLEDRLFVMGGVRREESDTTDTIFVSGANVLAPPTVIENPSDKATVPQVGASLRLLPGLNVFGSYSESFRPQRGVGRDINNDFFKKPPQKGEGVDFGLKFEVLDGRLSGTVSYFDITVTDIMGRTTPPGGGAAYDIVIDGRQVDGWEFDGVWQQGGNQLIVSYAKVSGEGIGADAGQRITGLPEQRFAVWNKYSFQTGRLKGLFLGAGWSYTADRVVSQGGPIFTEDGSYAVIDALVGYTTRIGGREVELRLNVKNLADEEYLYPGAAQANAYWGDPRSLYLTARINF